MTSILESLLRGLEPSVVTEVFLGLVAVLFFISAYLVRVGKRPAVTAHSPTLLASLGILGTFVGIVVGLLDFDPQQLDESIGGLLEGLKTAFVSSIAGLSASLVFRGLEPWMNGDRRSGRAGVGPEQVVDLLEEQRGLLQETRDAIAGGEESSLAGQLKLLRTDLSDRRRKDDGYRERFEKNLWEHLTQFAETLSKSATDQVIEALQKVIVDFNRNLTEQFGENFKRLDDSVGKLVEWQEGYRRQLEQLHSLYDQSVQQITTIEASVARIAERSESIPDSMEKLADAVKAARREIDELERHLVAFAELRDRAVAAVPQAQAHVETMTQDIAAAVRLAGERFTALQNDSDAQFTESRRRLEQLAQAGVQVQTDIQTVQDRVAGAITLMQSQVEGALKEALRAQREATDTLVQTTLDQTRQAVSRTGEGLTKQIEALDEALSREMNRVMQQMGNALGQITGKFVDDYARLVMQMKRIVRGGGE